MTRDGFLLYVLARHFPERLANLPPQVLENLSARITAGTYHSLSAGTTLLALDAYATATKADPRAASFDRGSAARDEGRATHRAACRHDAEGADFTALGAGRCASRAARN